jgi:uridine kinase
MTDAERFNRIEEAIIIMRDLLVNHEDRLDGHGQRLDDYYKAMRESREDFNFKLNALINLQMNNEIGIRELKNHQNYN